MNKKWQEKLFDIWCIASVIGVWPRFVEPFQLKVNKVSLTLPKRSNALSEMKIVHFSDLHYSASFFPSLRRKLISQINALSPDYIFFTGDFLCRSKLEDASGLKELLCSLKAVFGCYCVLGNHDYSEFVTVSQLGDFDTPSTETTSLIYQGFHRLFSSKPLTGVITKRAQSTTVHQELCHLLQETPFHLLHNETVQLSFLGKSFNLCGLGEYMCGKCDPHKAFAAYDSKLPGIVLVHNPDAIPLLKNFPGDLILAGHTHGGQVNLPFLWKRFTKIQHIEYKRGLKALDGDKWVYVNRGIGGVIPFRWFAPPEITLYTILSKD